MVITSSFTTGQPQEDGRWWVYEKHEVGDRSFVYEYLSDGSINPQLVLEERSELINNTLKEREAAKSFIIGTSVPLTRFEFLDRFTPAERVAIRESSKTNPIIEDFMEMMKMSGNVSLVLAKPGLDYLVAIGIILPERAVLIGAS